MKYLTEKEFEKEMAQIQQKKRQYEMKKELREAQDKIELLKNTSSKEITNVDMLRRISMLEKAVFRDNDNNY